MELMIGARYRALMFVRTRAFVLSTSLLALLAPTKMGMRAQSSGAAAPGPAAFLFEYRLTPGNEARFEEGYRRHLDWHRRKNDPLPWYGWNVATGERLDVFIDGSFGVPFAAFDQRVEPAADAADFDQTAGAFAVPLSRRVYRLRTELSTALPLENRKPGATTDVLHVLVKPGSIGAFERALADLRAAGAQGSGRPAYTCYSLVVGGELPAYLLMVVRDGWRTFDAPSSSPVDLLTGGRPDAAHRDRIADALRDGVRHILSETWSYRPDLSLVPSDGRNPGDRQ
jgi:hypothetical protein